VIHSTIASILKDRALAGVEPTDTVRSASQVMCKHDVRALAVTQSDKLVGVLSERDVIQKCVCPGKHTDEMRVSEAMTPDPKTLDANDSLAAALEIMGEGHFHHVPILDNGRVIGVLSSDDVPEEYRMLLERFKEIRGG
jgi:CBS domain-containing protein